MIRNRRRAVGQGDEDDAALMAAAAGGDRLAFAAIYDLYAALAYTVAAAVLRNDALAEDVVQDAFLQMWRHAARFDQRRGSLKAWLVQITRNRAVDILRQRRWISEIPLEEHTLLLSDEHQDPGEEAAGTWLRARTLDALRSLSPAHREVLALAYLAGHTHTEIAARLEMPLGSVKSRIREAVRALRRVLGEANDD